MKKLVHALREEPEKRQSGVISAMFSLARVINDNVKDLWEFLPDNNHQLAENRWQKVLSENSELAQQMQSSRSVAPGDLSSHSTAAPINTSRANSKKRREYSGTIFQLLYLWTRSSK